MEDQMFHILHTEHYLRLLSIKELPGVSLHCELYTKQIMGPSYSCSICNFYLHVKCAQLPQKINDHFSHPDRHRLQLQRRSPGSREISCNVCNRYCPNSTYFCDTCNYFWLDIPCALFLKPEFEHKFWFHQHPLHFFEYTDDNFCEWCSGCQRSALGYLYRCLDCSISFHKKCAELPRQINHPHHHKHPLLLLAERPDHEDACSCNLCEKDWKGFAYYCSVSKFGLSLVDYIPIGGHKHSWNFMSRMMLAKEKHQWTFMSRMISFICDFCGTNGIDFSYLCLTCNLVVHKGCIILPHTIKVTRHHHPISHTSTFKFDSKECRICYKEVTADHGSYCCYASNCNYVAHAKCATNRVIWDGKELLGLEDADEGGNEPVNLITNIISERELGGSKVATEIKHAYHEHNLILSLSGDGGVKDDNICVCDGCMRSISVSAPFYSCQQCIFFLHKDCAELPRQKRSPLHKHLLTLMEPKKPLSGQCFCCRQLRSGFMYGCNEGDCDFFPIGIQCSLLSDSLMHPSHDHLLFLDLKEEGKCSFCSEKARVVYRCTKRCDFAIDLKCTNLPITAWFKYDKHRLTLTFKNISDPSQMFCDLCEEKIDPNECFYYGVDCDNSVHPHCLLGDLPFVKAGSTWEDYRHEHLLTLVKKIWNCPKCCRCGELCNGDAVACEECNLFLHGRCV